MTNTSDSSKTRANALKTGLASITAAFVLAISATPGVALGAQTPPPNSAMTPCSLNPELVYDRDYPFMHYFCRAKHNPVARLQQELASGKVKLAYHSPGGYLDSVLKALKISPTSQVLVFSKTSLQTQYIAPATPRAIYFNENTYVAWIYHAPLLEINTMDSALGDVFYTLDELRPQLQRARLQRRTFICLACHDSFSMEGGGVPDFLFLSAYRISGDRVLTHTTAQRINNSTPMLDRWGGWYMTGKFGGMLDLANIIPRTSGQPPILLSRVSRANVPNLDRFFNTKPYLTNKSDVVALLVLENQVDIHNLIIHANYKSRMLLEKQKPGSSTEGLSFEALSANMQKKFAKLLRPLVRGLLLVGCAKLPAPVEGSSGFTQWFQAQGPFDSRGRSLRDLDLRTRVFKYPLSFLIYSKGFDHLIPSVKQYVYARLYQILSGRDRSPLYASLNRPRGKAALEILEQTDPAFARVAHEAERTGRTILTTSPSRSVHDAKATLRRSGPNTTSSIRTGATTAQTRTNANA